MASADVYDAIRAHLETSWTATPIVFENEPYDPDPASHWLMVEMAGTYYGRESIGTGDAMADRYDEAGTLMISCMAPANGGARVSRAHLKTVADLFRGAELMSGRLTFLDAQVAFGENVAATGQGASGNWYRLEMNIEWRVTEA